MSPPSGTVTFLFTDIEGSTKLAQANSEKYHESLKKHHDLIEETVANNNGFVFKLIGDAFCAAFENPGDAVRAAVSAQKALNGAEWGEAVIKVRMGIHTGSAEWNGSDYMGYMTLARTNRVMSSAYGGQILISGDSVNKIEQSVLHGAGFRDLGERRLKDLIQPMRLWQITSGDIPSEFPPLKTLDARPNNLPLQLTSFVGREKELAEVKNLFQSARLLTLLGPGGTGKTRLALQACADLIDEFTNGVWLSELALIEDRAGLLQTVIKTLGVEEIGQRSPEESIAMFLKDKEMILILDNCEHVIKESADLVEYLLRQTSKLRILATSREPLKCTGEQSYNIPSLAYPGSGEKVAPESLTQFESVRLFIERALLVNPKFRVTNENAPALSEVCSRLDGIPLAIELAAARMKAMSVEKLHARLDDRFNLLASGKRTALPRQQTLKALIDWSYDLLPEDEKLLWKRLSVFSGGFSLEAAEEVCSDDEHDEYSILDSVNNLTEKSILIYDDSAERYKMLETIHQYGLGLLTDKAEADNLYRKHGGYFKKFAVQMNVQFKSSNQDKAFDRLEADHGNLQSALGYCMNSGDYLSAADIAMSVSYFWIIRGYLSSGIHWLTEILKHEEHLPKKLLFMLLDKAGGLKMHQSDYDGCENYYRRSYSIKEELGERQEMSNSLNNLGAISARKGDYDEAGRMFEEYLSIIRDLNHRDKLPTALNNLALLELYTGSYEKAGSHIDECLKLSREFGDKENLYFGHRNAGMLAYYLKDYDKSADHHEKALEISRASTYKSGISVSLSDLAQTLIAKGDHKKARSLLEESLNMSKESDEKICVAMSYIGLGNLATVEGDDISAANYFGEAITLYREVGDLTGLVSALKSYARVKLDLDKAGEAKSALIECMRLNLKMGQKQEYPEVMFILACAFLRLNKTGEAFRLLGMARVAASDLHEKVSDGLNEMIDQKISEMQEQFPAECEKPPINEPGPDLKEVFEQIVRSDS